MIWTTMLIYVHENEYKQASLLAVDTSHFLDREY